MKDINKTLLLNDGNEIPSIGFGTYLLGGYRGVDAIVSALEVGYRLLDSAFMYENEGTVGKAIKSSSIDRSEIKVISKLPGPSHPYKKAVETVEESLMRAGLDYYDAYLIHWPNPKKDLYVEAWKALIDCQKRGLIKSIGVCNFLPEHIERLIDETGVTPSLNQVELHPYFNQQDLIKWHECKGIITQAWSPLGRGTVIASEAVIKNIAAIHGKTPTQVVLRWHMQSGSLPIPKASSKGHQIENLDVFDFVLSESEMQMVNGLSKPDGCRLDRRPNSYEEY